jgi:hypothetical protein
MVSDYGQWAARLSFVRSAVIDFYCDEGLYHDQDNPLTNPGKHTANIYTGCSCAAAITGMVTVTKQPFPGADCI